MRLPIAAGGCVNRGRGAKGPLTSIVASMAVCVAVIVSLTGSSFAQTAVTVPARSEIEQLIDTALVRARTAQQTKNSIFQRLMTADYCAPTDEKGERSNFYGTRKTEARCGQADLAQLLEAISLAYQRDVLGQRMASDRTLRQLEQVRAENAALRAQLAAAKTANAQSQDQLSQLQAEARQSAEINSVLVARYNKVAESYLRLSQKLNDSAALLDMKGLDK